MNPSATQQHHARSMMHLDASPRVPTTTYNCSSYNFFNFLSTYPSVAEDDVSISPSISGKTSAASLQRRTSTSHHGGDSCGA